MGARGRALTIAGGLLALAALWLGSGAAAAASAATAVSAATAASAAAAAQPKNLPPPQLPVTGASLLVAGQATPLWSLNGNAELPIASTTKLMTALVVLQRVPNLNTVMTQNDWIAAAGDSQIGLEPGERMTVRDLLTAMLVASADDAAEDLAYNVGGGSIARFVAMMNADAQGLGLTRTHYTTPIGLDTPGNYSSPDDLLRLADFLMREWPFFRHTVGLASATLTSGSHVRHITSTDDLLTEVPWIHGIKTGHTADAGYVLVSQGTRHGLTLLASVLGTSSEEERDESTLALLNWGFAEFRWVRPVRARELFVRRRLPGELLPATIVAAHDYRTVISRGTRVRVRMGRLRRLRPGMAAGTVVGQVRVLITGRRAVSVPLVLARAVPELAKVRVPATTGGGPSTLLLFALLLGGAAASVMGRWCSPRVLATGRVEER